MLATKINIIKPSHRSEGEQRAEMLGKRISEAEREFIEWLGKESPKTDVDTIEPLRSWRKRER